MQSKVLCRKLRLHSEMLCEVVLQNNRSVVAAVGSVVADAVTNVGATFACFVFIISFLLVVVITVAAVLTNVDTLVLIVVIVASSVAVILADVVEVVEVSVTGLGVIVIAFVVAANEFCFIPTGTVVDNLLLIISAAKAVTALADVDADLCCTVGGASFVLAVTDIALTGNFGFAVDVVAVDFGADIAVEFCFLNVLEAALILSHMFLITMFL